jgi:hypothetical protein
MPVNMRFFFALFAVLFATFAVNLLILEHKWRP